MARVVNCSRRTAVTTDEANDGLVAKVQEHNRKAHRTLIGREQGLPAGTPAFLGSPTAVICL